MAVIRGLNVTTSPIEYGPFVRGRTTWPFRRGNGFVIDRLARQAHSTALGDFEAEFSTYDEGVRHISGGGRPAGQQFPVISLECELPTNDEMHCITHTVDEAGLKFQSNEERYSRRP